jgi:hypothetical protein
MVNRLDEADYEELEAFVEKREALMEQIRTQEEQKPFLANHSERVSRILEHDHAIKGRMLALKLEASDALARMDQGKKQKSAYEAAYSPDSYFFDKRK